MQPLACVLGGPQIRTDVEIFSYPGRYEEEDGRAMWGLVNSLAKLLTEEPTQPPVIPVC